jgi:hypothetical protein
MIPSVTKVAAQDEIGSSSLTRQGEFLVDIFFSWQAGLIYGFFLYAAYLILDDSLLESSRRMKWFVLVTVVFMVWPIVTLCRLSSAIEDSTKTFEKIQHETVLVRRFPHAVGNLRFSIHISQQRDMGEIKFLQRIKALDLVIAEACIHRFESELGVDVVDWCFERDVSGRVQYGKGTVNTSYGGILVTKIADIH